MLSKYFPHWLSGKSIMDETSLRIHIFNMLAISGIVMTVIFLLIAFITDTVAKNIILNILPGIVCIGLLILSSRTGSYKLCYALSIILCFLILFPLFFFTGGGYIGGMPVYFVFAVVFTSYMLDGLVALLVVSLELLIYVGISIYAYFYPLSVTPLQNDQAILIDILATVISVSCVLIITMRLQLNLYKRHHKALHLAKQHAEAANQTKTTFLASISHEIRTPLHLILNLNEMISRQSSNREVLEYTAGIRQAGVLLQALGENVLDMAKIETGQLQTQAAWYDPAALVDILSFMGQNLCQKKGLAFHLHRGADLPASLYGDLSYIRHIAVNLLENAIKYTDQGKVNLSIDALPHSAEMVHLKISVKDTGIGISSENIPHLFEPFTRITPFPHRHITGAGLGLTIVKHLTEKMHGTIDVSSTPGAGSTFTVHIPQRLKADGAIPKAPVRWSFRAPSASLLVVDDQEENLALLRALLRRTGMKLETARSGAECIERVRHHAYDVILLDRRMPDKDGLETLTELKQLPEFHTPVIALTADATLSTQEELLSHGFSAYLTKPVSPEELEREIAACLPPPLVERLPITEDLPATSGEIKALVSAAEPAAAPREPQKASDLITPVIDTEFALSYFANDHHLYQEAARIFLRHAEKGRQDAARLLQEKNSEQLRLIFHSLKGRALNLGLMKLAGAAAELENLAAAGEEAALAALAPYGLYLWQQADDVLKNIVLADDNSYP